MDILIIITRVIFAFMLLAVVIALLPLFIFDLFDFEN